MAREKWVQMPQYGSKLVVSPPTLIQIIILYLVIDKCRLRSIITTGTRRYK
jgi:hypothetical protein